MDNDPITDYGVDQLGQMLKLSHVPRWAIVDVDRKQSVSDHCFRVAMISYKLHQEMVPEVSLDLGKMIMLSLFHDWEESYSGDIPTNWKEEQDYCTPSVWDDSMESRLVQMVDTIEALIFIRRYGKTRVSVDAYLRKKLMDQMEEFVKLYDSPWIFKIVDSIIKEGISYE